eukprot:CAMPEP_0197684336 /NCGR_PEP_ID=MMETSP1338-20131121/99351_1 /TAXON_ID=43686 ORGANISM="Pelagodinium beii, Strain RCC1491" /NCGR_SAMPLE_ID=MMETSP1338 /ASSEMBLY_ACC=CAM_ASM_000754 /LENGTH=85 /DNA_ID=CAMNT_0043266039 /DNA_START=631 /DNA_END=885 /DNA_ORIENTATION=+
MTSATIISTTFATTVPAVVTRSSTVATRTSPATIVTPTTTAIHAIIPTTSAVEITAAVPVSIVYPSFTSPSSHRRASAVTPPAGM